MRFFFAPILCLFLATPPLLAEEAAKEHLTFRFDHDSFFQSYPTLTLEHPLSGNNSFTASFVTYVAYHSIELDMGWTHMIGAWMISPVLGATSGSAAWGSGTDMRNYVGRDIVPQLGFYYSSPSWEGEASHGAWIPTQESPNTSLWYTQTRWWVVAKRNGFGLGPHLETFGSKEGRRSIRLSQFWAGAHLLKELPKGSFQLFLGYDTVALVSYQGAPKKAGAAFRATFIYPLF